MKINIPVLLLSSLGVFFTPAQAVNEFSDLRGITKTKVTSKHGTPDYKEGPVGDPPITKWMYPEFTVVFEYNHVIHAYKRDYDLEKRPSSSVADRPSQVRKSRGDTLNLP